MADREVVIRIKAANQTKAEFEAARRQLDALGKQAGLTKADVSQLGKGFQGAAKDLANFNPTAARASSLLGGFGPAGLAAGAGIGAMAAAVGFGVRELVSMGSELTRLERVLGVSSQGIQQLQFAAGQLEIPFDTVTRSVNELKKRVGEGLPKTVGAIGDLGLSLEKLRASDAEGMLLDVVTALSKIENPAKQAAAGSALFGKAWAEMRLRPEDLKELLAAMETAPALSDDAKEAGERLGDEWDRLLATSKVLALEGVAPLASTLADLASTATDNIRIWKLLFAEWKRGSEDLQKFAGLGGLPSLEDESGIRGADAAAAARRRKEALEAARKANAGLFQGMREGLKVTDDFGDSTDRLARLEESRSRVLRELNKMQSEGGRVMAELAFQQQALSDALLEFPATAGAIPGLTSLGGTPFLEEIPSVWREWKLVIPEVKDETEELVRAQEDYNEALQSANALAQLIGGNIGQLVGQTLAAGAALSNLSSLGGLSGAFKAGKGEATGFLGLLGGIGGVAGAVGPFVGLGVSLVNALKGMFGRNAQDVAKDLGRDIGAAVSNGLAEQILKSGQNAQFFLKEIFSEGGLGIDQFAREVGDLFSFFERGELSRTGLIGELKETLPILIQNMSELGPTGEEQIGRITAAAERLGINIAEIDQLMQATFAPETMESIAASFGITNDQVRELGDLLGVEVQTNLERMAASLGLSVDEFQKLGAAVSERFGIPMDKIDELLVQMGGNVENLAASLGIDVAAGATGFADAAAAGNIQLEAGAGWASLMADELERGARAMGSMSFGGGPSIPGFQHGGFVPETWPHGRLVRVAEPGTGGETMTPGRGGGAQVVLHIGTIDARGAQHGVGDEIAAALANVIGRGRNPGGIDVAIRRVVEGG